MSKVILLTGATDGIGFETAKMLAKEGHSLLLHGRNQKKLENVVLLLGEGNFETYVADLSNLKDVENLALEVSKKHSKLDVLINNAGVYKTPNEITEYGIDIRFVVNTIAPYLLTQKLFPLMDETSRVVNLSSAAQATVGIDALLGKRLLSDGEAYAQSKLAITMWTKDMAEKEAPMIVAVNPKSLLGSKMVKEAYGISGGDLTIGADILYRASLSNEFANASGKYFDNDSGQFALPHPDGLDSSKCKKVVETIEQILKEKL